jgi:hypothetical protein
LPLHLLFATKKTLTTNLKITYPHQPLKSSPNPLEMAPAVRSAVVVDTDMLTLLRALASCTELNLNTKALAEQEGIARSDNA